MFTLEWLGQGRVVQGCTSYEMGGKDSDLSAEWVQSDQEQ